jgi:hypothetical protein
MKFKHRSMEDDSLFEMALGLIFGLGAGVCLIGITVSLIIAFAPQWLPQPLLLLLGATPGDLSFE